MKQIYIILIALIFLVPLHAQHVSNCQVVEWTLDDLTFTPQNSFDFGSLIQTDCGCAQSGLSASNCVLVKLTLVKTINGQLYEQDCSKLLFTGGWFPGRPNDVNASFNFVDIYSAVTCGKQFPQASKGPNQDIFQLQTNTPPGGVVEFLVCQGSVSSPMKGYFSGFHFCNDTGTPYVPPVTTSTNNPPDYDNDGIPDHLDCVPTNPNIYPGATEIPNNGIDEDCNGSDLVVNTPVTPSNPKPRPGSVRPGKPQVAPTSVPDTRTVRLDRKKIAYCYANGKLGKKNDCANCNNPNKCIVLNFSKKNTMMAPGAKKYVNVKLSELEKFLQSQGGKYTGNAIVCGDGRIMKGTACAKCGSGKAKTVCRIIDIASSK